MAMAQVENSEDLKKTLSTLTLAQQRQIGAQFITRVLDLTDGSCDELVKKVAAQGDISDEDLDAVHHAAQQYFAATNLRPYAEVDYRQQAAHFVANALVVCAGPVYGGHKANHLAELIAGYCRMARTCAAFPHEEGSPSLADAEASLQKEVEGQYKIVNAFLSE